MVAGNARCAPPELHWRARPKLLWVGIQATQAARGNFVEISYGVDCPGLGPDPTSSTALATIAILGYGIDHQEIVSISELLLLGWYAGGILLRWRWCPVTPAPQKWDGSLGNKTTIIPCEHTRTHLNNLVTRVLTIHSPGSITRGFNKLLNTRNIPTAETNSETYM